MRRKLPGLLYVPGSLLIAALSAELVIRALISAHAGVVRGFAFQKQMDVMLHRVWDSPYHGRLSPPFPLFADREDDNPGRLRKIYPFSLLPPRLDEEVPDFLLPPGTSSYRVRSTLDGFRGDPAAVPAQPAYRILCLGSYMTFGEGLDDSRIWTARLQDLLGRKLGRPVRVMNGGLNSSTAIVGLARLSADGAALKPDLIILEYGNLDTITEDIIPRDDPRIPDESEFLVTSREWRERRWNSLFLAGPLRHSYVAYFFYDLFQPWFVGDPHWAEEGTGYYEQTMRHLAELAKSVAPDVMILAGQLTGARKIDVLSPLSAREGIPFLVADEILRKNSALFQKDPAWIGLYGEPRAYYEQEPMYRGILGAFRNPYQLNAAAHELIAERLSEEILPLARARLAKEHARSRWRLSDSP